MPTTAMPSLQQLVHTSKLPTIVLFYATWSHKCKEEMELFEVWSKDDHHKLANFVLVSLDENVRETVEFLDHSNPNTSKARVCRGFRDEDAPTVLHSVYAVESVPEPYGVQHVPHKVVIDHEGIMRRNNDGFVWDDVAGLLQYRRELKAALEVEPTSTVLFLVFIKT